MVMAKKIVFEIIADSDSTTPVSYTHLVISDFIGVYYFVSTVGLPYDNHCDRRNNIE